MSHRRVSENCWGGGGGKEAIVPGTFDKDAVIVVTFDDNSFNIKNWYWPATNW